MPVKIQALASGSNGNCFFIGSPEGSILIDAGISYKSLKEKLAAINESENNIKAIFISHAHTDHMKGLPVIIKNLKVPVIASEQTLHHLYRYEEVITGGSNILDYGVFLYSKTIGHIGPFKYTNVMTKHDIEGATAFKVQYIKEGLNISVVTDTGTLYERGIKQLSNSDVVMVESNHDLAALKTSKRPEWLKERIINYHLSNRDTELILQTMERQRVKAIILSHLSEECNSPDLVAEWVRNWSKCWKPDWDWYLSSREAASDLLVLTNKEIKQEKKISGKIEW